MAKLGKVRRSQLITTYGVGSIIAVEEESVMVAGIDFWPAGTPDVHEPRLERKLKVRGFVRPPATGKDGGKDIPVTRFPTMYSCPACNRLARHSQLADPNQNKCNACGVPLIPSRFIMACEKGHIDDFPYFEWVHLGVQFAPGTAHDLTISTEGASASLEGVKITCKCGASRTMKGAFAKNALKGVKRCTGARPWLGLRDETCLDTPRGLQRGASNVYFAVTPSSLSIPPWSEGAFKIINRYWTVLSAIPEIALLETVKTMKLAQGTPYKPEDLVLAVQQRKAGDDSGGYTNTEFRYQEYEALMVGKDEVSRDQDFVCVRAEDAVVEVAPWIDQVMLAKRLREVRALESFTRLRPPSPADPAERRALLSASPLDWLPAIEVLGEGIFLHFNQDRLKQWEELDEVRNRAARINKNYSARATAVGTAPDRIITPRLLLIHTLAHILINEWSLECGYPAASLRERLYVSQPGDAQTMEGVLIYTATTDSAGSLGGVVAQARPGRLGLTVAEAVRRASWCSADPLCIEADAAGVDSLNLAACHACLLLPEVSCEEANVLLDRAFIVGTPEAPEIGYFADLVGPRT